MDKLSLLKTGIIGAAAAQVYNAFRVGQRIPPTTSRTFPTFSMKSGPSRARRVAGRRRRYIRPRRSLKLTDYRRVVRCGGTFDSTQPANSSFFATTHNFSLNDVKTDDLVAAYRLFRLRKVVVYVTPRLDPANSGLVNNFQARISAACDPEGVALGTLTGPTIISAYDNSRDSFVTSGKTFKYTFYPKCVNTVDNAGTATAAGSYAMNPWLQLNATGIQIPHRQLLLGYSMSGVTTGLAFSRYFEYHFDVKGMA